MTEREQQEIETLQEVSNYLSTVLRMYKYHIAQLYQDTDITEAWEELKLNEKGKYNMAFELGKLAEIEIIRDTIQRRIKDRSNKK